MFPDWKWISCLLLQPCNEIHFQSRNNIIEQSYFQFTLAALKIVATLVWGIKLKKVDLSWPAVFSKSYNPSWIELNFLSSPWIELTQILHICPRLDLTQVEPTNSSQLRVDPKLKKINFFQVNSRKSWKNLNFFKNLF